MFFITYVALVVKYCVYKALMNLSKKNTVISILKQLLVNCSEMAEFNKIRLLMFVSLMTFPTHALDVIFLSALADFKQKAEIDVGIIDGRKAYLGTSNEVTYQAQPGTSKVIVYIIDRSRFVEIIRNAVHEIRLQINTELFQSQCELVFLGIENFEDDEYDVICGFIIDKMTSPSEPTFYTIATAGEDRFDRFFRHEIFGNVLQFPKYQESAHICGGNLLARLKSISRGALRPVGSNNKEIKLFGYSPFWAEVTWRVSVENSTYIPEVDVNDPTYNFKIRYPNRQITLLILSGKEYSKLMNLTKRSRVKKEQETIKKEQKTVKKEMTSSDDVLLIMGVFNFDWTEIDLVAQIILAHSGEIQSSDYKVFTYGYGMFNTHYRNMYVNDPRRIFKQSSLNVLEMIKGLMGEEVKERAIKLHYSFNGWRSWEIPINSINGRYVPAEGFNFTFQWPNQEIAFIVYDSAEKNNPFDLSSVLLTVNELERNGIRAVVIEAINFGLDDIHIVAQWIERHSKGTIHSEQIAVLGAGIFDTIFQSRKTTYKTFFNTKKDELKLIRNAYVAKGNGKRVFAVNMDDPEFEVWSYPMNTVNGFYEPDLIPDQNTFDPDGKRILFIVTSGYNFRQISSLEDAGSQMVLCRHEIESYYPSSEWSVFLVGLDNFGERDAHLFAELVRKQTNTNRVRIHSYGIRSATYQYMDTKPITKDSNILMNQSITSCIALECELSQLSLVLIDSDSDSDTDTDTDADTDTDD